MTSDKKGPGGHLSILHKYVNARLKRREASSTVPYESERVVQVSSGTKIEDTRYKSLVNWSLQKMDRV